MINSSQLTAAHLASNEMVPLEFTSPDLLLTIINSPMAPRIRSLKLAMSGDVEPLIQSLAANCPGLVELEAESAELMVKLLSGIPSVTCAHVTTSDDRDAWYRLLSALDRSSVTELHLDARRRTALFMHNYLTLDKLTSLTLKNMASRTKKSVFTFLEGCTNLRSLTLVGGVFVVTGPMKLPPSLVRLELDGTLLRTDWSFLPESSITELCLRGHFRTNLEPFAEALKALLLRGKMEKLTISFMEQSWMVTRVLGSAIANCTTLEILDQIGNQPILDALEARDSRLRELTIHYGMYLARQPDHRLLAALDSPNCRLRSLTLNRGSAYSHEDERLLQAGMARTMAAWRRI